MVLTLAVAALAIYGVVFLVKRLARRPEVQDPYLKVLASVRLGTGAFAAVLSLGSRAWLVGGGSAGVSLLADIDDPETLESMLLEDSRRSAAGAPGRFPDFRALLDRMGKPGNAPAAPGSEAAAGGEGDSLAGSLRRQRERLKGL